MMIMSRTLFVLFNDEIRARVCKFVMGAPKDTRITFQEPKRTLDQNARMWAMLTDISEQKEHAGRKYDTDEWKCLFLHALEQEIKFFPSLDYKTFVPIGQRSSGLSIAEMADMITLMDQWGAENGVEFQEPKVREFAP